MRPSLLPLVFFITLVMAQPSSAQTTPLQSFHLRATTNAVRATDSFRWPMTTDIDAVLRVDVPAPATAQVLLVIDSGGEVLAKHKSKHQLAAGSQELRLPKVFATDRLLGQRNLTAKLEFAVKGYPVERRDFAFEVIGPPTPNAEITSLRIYEVQTADPASARAVSQFKPGQPFMVEVVFNVLDNPAKLKPDLIVLASMVEDEAFTAYELQRQFYDEHYDIKSIELEEGAGARRVVLRGTAPQFFAQPWQNRHPFKVYAALDFGNGERVTRSIDSEVFDYTPSEVRRSDDPARRLFTIARASSWSVSLPQLEELAAPVQ